MQDDPIRNEDLDITRAEMAADPATCRKPCCMPTPSGSEASSSSGARSATSDSTPEPPKK
jgi:hypothetical protein